jgi:hypothetical protein
MCRAPGKCVKWAASSGNPQRAERAIRQSGSRAAELRRNEPNEVTVVQGRQRPMDQEQINVIGAERLECAIERSTRIVWSVEPIVEHAGDVNVAAI